MGFELVNFSTALPPSALQTVVTDRSRAALVGDRRHRVEDDPQPRRNLVNFSTLLCTDMLLVVSLNALAVSIKTLKVSKTLIKCLKHS